MSIIADALRPFWLPGINNVTGKTLKDIGGWICDENYQIYDPVATSGFSLHVFSIEPMCEAFAAEVTRIATAAFETMNHRRIDESSKSVAWILIEHYYAAFFAAHALLRMTGLGCGPIGKSQTTSIMRVASGWGVHTPKTMSGGLYQFCFSAQTTTFSGTAMSGSPHEGFWVLFDSRLKEISSAVLNPSTALTLDTASRQSVSTKLDELRRNLNYLNAGKASWLTQIRNSINYDHRLATWYPYTGRQKYYDDLRARFGAWQGAAMDVDLSSYGAEDLLRFQSTCNFILAMCRESIEEMSLRCSAGKSFHQFGALAFLNMSRGSNV